LRHVGCPNLPSSSNVILFFLWTKPYTGTAYFCGAFSPVEETWNLLFPWT
jgi:hypothetical protein